jgi:hypothetical protein
MLNGILSVDRHHRAELAKNAGISLAGYDATEVRLAPSEKLDISRIRYRRCGATARSSSSPF